MENSEKKTNEALRELEANVRDQEARESLFQEKVLLIGRLHTRRALLANRVGALKSEAAMKGDRFDDASRERIMEIERTMRSISKDITDFSPSRVDELKVFESEIGTRFDEVGRGLAEFSDEGAPKPGDE